MHLFGAEISPQGVGVGAGAVVLNVARGGDLPRASYGASVACFADALAARLDGPEQWRQDTARTVMSLCVGALVLARAGMDRHEARALFEACRHTAVRLGEAR
jgi:hypothetical protein